MTNSQLFQKSSIHIKKNNFLNLINKGEAIRDFIHIDDVTYIYNLILKQKKKRYR